MFSVRRLSPRVLTVLTAAGLGLVGLVATAGPASAHSTTSERDCSTVTITGRDFPTRDLNHVNAVTVHIMDAKGNDLVTPAPVIHFTASTFRRTFDNIPNVRLHITTKWDVGDDDFWLNAKKGCTPPPPECQRHVVFIYTFDGPNGVATVTPEGKSPLCTPITVLLASFKTEGADFEHAGHQTVFDQVSQVIEQPKTYTLHVKVPDCFTQVDLYVTDKKAVDFDSPNDTLGGFLAERTPNFFVSLRPRPDHGTSHFNGGTVGCTVETTPPPTTTPPTSPTAPPTTVAPTSTAPAAPAPPGTSLPNTGASPMPKILLAIVLLGAGTGLVFLGRRRRRIV